jgi:hypothetical protein
VFFSFIYFRCKFLYMGNIYIEGGHKATHYIHRNIWILLEAKNIEVSGL